MEITMVATLTEEQEARFALFMEKLNELLDEMALTESALTDMQRIASARRLGAVGIVEQRSVEALLQIFVEIGDRLRKWIREAFDESLPENWQHSRYLVGSRVSIGTVLYSEHGRDADGNTVLGSKFSAASLRNKTGALLDVFGESWRNSDVLDNRVRPPLMTLRGEIQNLDYLRLKIVERWPELG